jgi:hypothetical protein
MKAIIIASLASAIVGCSGPMSADDDPSTGTPITWEDFLNTASQHQRVVNGENIYIVEWDLPLRETQLREYYRKRYVEVEKSTVDVKSNGADNVWSPTAKLHLAYCVSTAFGGNYNRVVSEMKRATWAWQRTGNVNLSYKPSEDANCNDSNAAVDIPVEPYSDGGACAFFPDDDGQPACTSHGRAIVIDIADIDTWPTQPIWGKMYPNVSTEGTFRHELGHVLGMRHEHIRELDNAVDFCAQLPSEVLNPGAYRALTSYDVNSAMHYPWCDGVIQSSQQVTFRDGQGLTRLYGAAAWISSDIL